jgi:hypothetical protein
MSKELEQRKLHLHDQKKREVDAPQAKHTHSASSSVGVLRVAHQQFSPGCPVMDYPPWFLPASSSSEQLELSKEEPWWWLSLAYRHH